MTIHLVPLKQFSEYHGLGWRIVPGYDLKAGDYAATMKSPDHDAVVAGNKSLAAVRRNQLRGKKQPSDAYAGAEARA